MRDVDDPWSGLVKRGFLLLLAGVVAIAWFVAPVAARTSSRSPERVGAGAIAPATPIQRSTTTTSTIPPSTTAVPTTAPTTVAAVVTTAAPSTTQATDDTLTREDPAATRLRRITYGLAGLGGLILVLTVVFWKVTRPALLLPPKEVAPKPTEAIGAEAEARSRRSAAARPAVPATSGAPAKIPASVILATPPAASLASTLAAAPVAGASIAAMSAPPLDDRPLDDPPPSGQPAIDAPAPLDDIPLGAPKPLVGNDSAWIIEPESSSGLIADTPTATDFPPDAAEPVSEPEPAPVPLSEAAPEIPHETKALISALSAIPDKEPTRVRFDDPPVERIPQRRSPASTASEPSEPDPEPTASEPSAPQPEPAPEPDSTSTRERSQPAGAPGFDRLAKEATAKQQALSSGMVDDMALMASALSSLPPRDLPDLPPVGEFYDQDLDPGDPPGRPRPAR